MAPANTVQGQIILPAAPGASQADVIVQVEDVSRADAPSIVIAEHRQRGVHLTPGGVLPFKLEVPTDRVEENHSYSVRAHIDVSGSGEVEEGDFITTESYPVLTRGYGNDVRLKVQRV